MNVDEISKKSLLNKIHASYGYDFTGYAGGSLDRRISRFADLWNISTAGDLEHRLLNDSVLFEDFLLKITVNVTEMFRNPSFYKSIREKVFPAIATYPFRRIWHAGCSTGEEVYSMAVLLKENNLYDHTRIYATDINARVLETAVKAEYKPYPFHSYNEKYLDSGGMRKLDDYYEPHGSGRIKMDNSLGTNITFSPHNLASDSTFNEFNLIVCRNVLIYFNTGLQEKVLGLFCDSLCNFGFLALGSKENMLLSSLQDRFEVVDKHEKIYRKIA